MTTIGVRELRQNASMYLAMVEAGEELDVTNNGRLVARLVPVPQASRSLETLINAGGTRATTESTGAVRHPTAARG